MKILTQMMKRGRARQATNKSRACKLVEQERSQVMATSSTLLTSLFLRWAPERLAILSQFKNNLK